MLKGTIRRHLLGGGLGARLIRASAGSVGLRVVSMALTFAVGVLLARILGPAGYGIYALVMAVTALLTVPTQFGLPSLVLREVASAHARQDWGRMRGILRWANTITGALSLFLLAGVVAAFLFGARRDASTFAHAVFWGIVLVPFIALGNLRGATLRGLRLVVRGQFPELILRPGLFVFLLMVTLLFSVNLTPAHAIALNVAAAVVTFAVGTGMLFRNIPSPCRLAKPVTETKAWLLSALPFALTDGMRNLQQHLVTLLLAWLVTKDQIGIYRVAGQSMLLVALPASILVSVLAPHVAAFHAEARHERLQRLASFSAAGMFVGTLGISLGLLFFGPALLELCFGTAFRPAYLPMMILCIGQLANAFAGPNATLLNMTGHEGTVAVAFAVSILMNVGTTLTLTPLFGITGAAVATSLGLVACNVVLWREVRRRLGVHPSVLGLIRRPRPAPADSVEPIGVPFSGL